MPYEDESIKKWLPCLKCGKKFWTQIQKRICVKCDESNKNIIGIKGRFPISRRSAKQNTFKVD